MSKAPPSPANSQIDPALPAQKGQDRRAHPLVKKIKALFADGLQTQVDPFPETDVESAKLLDELRALPPDDLKAKLVLSGWMLAPYGEDQMRCQECMYYLVHKRWCDLPELNLPAEPHWWCRLWRV